MAHPALSDAPPPLTRGDSRLSVVVPVHDGARTLTRCIDAILQSSRRPAEIVVVDDGSSDDSAQLARQLGCRVVRIPDGPRGPACARNAGARASRGDVIVFVDSDVEVHPEALGRIAAPLLRPDAEVSATFGSYDDDPDDRGLVSLYANLRHHSVHQGSPDAAETFWAGLGGVRRSAFGAVGGFDARYGEPSIEDIDLGVRLRTAGGQIRVVRDALCKHLKRWTLLKLWSTDVFRRAVAWSRLLLTSGSSAHSLNLNPRERASALLALAAAAGALAALLLLQPVPAWVALGALVLWSALNARFLGLLVRRGGLRGGMAGAGLHLAYYLYSTAAYGTVAMASAFRWSRARPR